jgi:hypothetical protein
MSLEIPLTSVAQSGAISQLRQLWQLRDFCNMQHLNHSPQTARHPMRIACLSGCEEVAHQSLRQLILRKPLSPKSSQPTTPTSHGDPQ